MKLRTERKRSEQAGGLVTERVRAGNLLRVCAFKFEKRNNEKKAFPLVFYNFARNCVDFFLEIWYNYLECIKIGDEKIETRKYWFWKCRKRG